MDHSPTEFVCFNSRISYDWGLIIAQRLPVAATLGTHSCTAAVTALEAHTPGAPDTSNEIQALGYKH